MRIAMKNQTPQHVQAVAALKTFPWQNKLATGSGNLEATLKVSLEDPTGNLFTAMDALLRVVSSEYALEAAESNQTTGTRRVVVTLSEGGQPGHIILKHDPAEKEELSCEMRGVAIGQFHKMGIGSKQRINVHAGGHQIG